MKVKITLATKEFEVAENAAVCYGSKSSESMLNNIVHNHKHLSVLRFAYMTVSIEDISIACQNQLVRSKHLDFLVESKRYCEPDKFIMPQGLERVHQEMMAEHWSHSLHLYSVLREAGVKKEDARAILPMNTATKVRATGNLQAWIDFIKLRVNAKAQKEIRELAMEIWRQAREKFPIIFGDDLKINEKTWSENVS
jgi:thymidylate synthase (FAD)